MEEEEEEEEEERAIYILTWCVFNLKSWMGGSFVMSSLLLSSLCLWVSTLGSKGGSVEIFLVLVI